MMVDQGIGAGNPKIRLAQLQEALLRYYTLGKLEIQALARDYMQARTASLQQFYDGIVAEGGLPIPLVRKILLR